MLLENNINYQGEEGEEGVDEFESSISLNKVYIDFDEYEFNNGIIEPNNNKLLSFFDNYFQISESGSNIKTELYAGLINFLAMSYILACNPNILLVSGIDIQYASSGTSLATFIGTFIAGFLGNIPIGCAPGIGLSAYFSYSVMSEINNHNLGLLFVFLSGLIVFLLTLLKIPPYLINNIIPKFIKVSTIVGMGLFLSFIGLTEVGLIKKGSNTLLQIGDLTDWRILLFIFNFFLITFLDMKKIYGSMILSIIFTSILYYFISDEWPTEFISKPNFDNIFNIINKENFQLFIQLPLSKIFNILFSFIMVMILDVGGVTFAITKIGNINNSEKMTYWGLISISIGTLFASIFGCSPLIVHIESIAGILVGGRTGLTSITTSFFFLLSLILTPLFNNLPLCSTTSITIFIGALMMKQCKNIDWEKNDIALSAFLTIIMMPFTYSISYGIYFGLGIYFIFSFLKIKNWYIIFNFFKNLFIK
jgi:AGZA family xanthine/uracil permease-like MFS transporter